MIEFLLQLMYLTEFPFFRNMFETLEVCQKQITSLQDKLRQTILKENSVDDEINRCELLAQVPDINQPVIDKSEPYGTTTGYRFIDLQTFHVALAKTQECGCNFRGILTSYWCGFFCFLK